jgi:hypothetical protein
VLFNSSNLLLKVPEHDVVDFERIASHKSFIWRLKTSPTPNHGGYSVLELLQEEKFPPSTFIPTRSFLSEKYIVTSWARVFSLVDDGTLNYELLVEVRSTVDFNVIYSIKERAICFFFFSFVNDIMSVQICQPTGNFVRYS